jgi:PTH1 family peptidyl-tRNA hydrolase
MKLIVGLGNPGKQYEITRHNSGFMFVNALAQIETKGSFEWKLDKMFDCEILKTKDAVLLRPQNFMNNSGDVVKKYMQKNGFTVEDLVVVYDDLDIKFGKFKISQSKSPKEHNGVNDIIRALGTSTFLHIRIGVDARGDGQRSILGLDYVLMKFSSEEIIKINELFIDILKELKVFISNGTR